VNSVVEAAIGGMTLTTTIEGRERFPSMPVMHRNIEAVLKEEVQVQTMEFGPIPLSTVADIKISDGPPMINSENAMLRGSVLFNVRDRDLGGKEAQDKLNAMMTKMPKGYYRMEWAMEKIRANKTLSLIMPMVIIIFLILYFTYNSMKEAFVTIITVPLR
jgi:Cu(I)/Ag(I) efflux system membrane protein CusA/SilA